MFSHLFRRFSDRPVYREAANNEDLEFIVDRCIKEAQAGHFSEIYASPIPAIQGGLRVQIICAIEDRPFPLGPDNPRNGTGAKILIIERKRKRVGFILLLEDMPGSWHEKIELHLLSILPEYRRHGLGEQVVKDMLRIVPAREIYARCYAKSTAMISLLMQLGFETIQVSNRGTKTLMMKR